MAFYLTQQCHTNLTNPTDHTTVCQTSFFFLKHFTPGSQWPWDCGMVTDVYGRKWFEKKMKKPGLRDREMVTDGPCQKPDWKKMTRSVRQSYGFWWVKKPRSVRPWYGQWCPGVKCLRKKKLVWHTVVWSLGFVEFVWSLVGEKKKISFTFYNSLYF